MNTLFYLNKQKNSSSKKKLLFESFDRNEDFLVLDEGA